MLKGYWEVQYAPVRTGEEGKLDGCLWIKALLEELQKKIMRGQHAKELITWIRAPLPVQRGGFRCQVFLVRDVISRTKACQHTQLVKYIILCLTEGLGPQRLFILSLDQFWRLKLYEDLFSKKYHWAQVYFPSKHDSDWAARVCVCTEGLHVWIKVLLLLLSTLINRKLVYFKLSQ